jgi:hypothetical protein
VKRTVLWLTTLVLFVGCENSAGLFGVINGGGGGLTAAQATGTWTFTLQQTTTFPACTAPLANSQTIVATLVVLSDGTLNTTSSWQNPISFAVQPLTGAVALTSGLSDLFFAAPAVRAGAQMELRGTMTALGGFTGTLTDPESGFSQVFGTGGCEYNVAGIKTG